MPDYHENWEIVYTFKEYDNIIVVFFFDWYKERKYANIRKCIESASFKGPTKKGLTFKEELIKPILTALNELRQTELKDGLEIAKIEKNFTTRIIISVVNDEGHFKVDMREYIITNRYIGPTKKGIRLGYENISKLIEGFKMLEEGS